MADIGRKAWITLYGMTAVVLTTAYAMYANRPVPDGMFNAIARLVSVFCVGNAAVSVGYSLTEQRQTTVAKQITEAIAARRSATGDGTEETP